MGPPVALALFRKIRGHSYYEVSQYLLVDPVVCQGCTAVVGVERPGAWVSEPEH